MYTVGVALASLDQLLGWLNTLMSTVLSVFSALVVGLVLFRLQTGQTDKKRREELAALLAASQKRAIVFFDEGFHEHDSA